MTAHQIRTAEGDVRTIRIVAPRTAGMSSEGWRAHRFSVWAMAKLCPNFTLKRMLSVVI